MGSLTATTVPRIASTQAGREMVAGDTLVVDCPTGTYRLLNGAAGFIWSHIDGARSVAEIAEALAREYDIDADAALGDTQAFLDDALARGMLVMGSDE